VIRVLLPTHLRKLAQVNGEVRVDLAGPATQRSVLDALEATYPMLRGTIRDQTTFQRRAFIRFFACEQDLSNESPDAPVPEPVASGSEPFMVVGAMAGGVRARWLASGWREFPPSPSCRCAGSPHNPRRLHPDGAG